MDEYPVLVVGAGLAGLSAAMFLGVHGVPALVVERHATTSLHPKARGQFPHTMEALRVAGVDRRIAAAAPADPGFHIVVAESVTGRVYNDIVVDTAPDFGALSPAGWANASQERVEPILADRARELGAELRFSTELVSFTQDEDGVTALLADGTTVRARYLVAADGHRSPVREALGIGTHGRGDLGRSSGVLFDGDLGRTGFGLFYLQNPALPGGAGVVVGTDTPHRWALSVGYDPEIADWTSLIRTATGRPDLDPVLVGGEVTTGHTSVRVADRFSAGRVHLIGDAARVMPPTGAFGGNTAILDGYSLAWKLALVVRGEAGPGLLDSHDVERRPYSELLVEQQYRAFVERMSPGLADDTLAEPVEPPSALFFGHRQLGAIVAEPDDDGALLENPEQPTGRPGSRAPHVRLADGSSTVDLFGRGFVVLTGSATWAAAAAQLGLSAHRLEGWTTPYGVTAEGAVLVRPDGFVAWRSVGEGPPGEGARASARALARALALVLAR